MKNRTAIIATRQPNGDGHQVTYTTETSRKVHHFPEDYSGAETPPHGAGSFHDPDQHYRLMQRVTDYLAGQTA